MKKVDSVPIRDVRLGPCEVAWAQNPDGAVYVRSAHPVGPYPAKLTERLEHWAEHAPGRAFIGQRDANGNWRTRTYSEMRSAARNAAQALLARDLSADRPIAILSGNGIEHAILALGAMYAGIPYSPISPAYSLISSDFGKLRHIFGLLTPGLVFACGGPAYRMAIEAVVPVGVEVVTNFAAFDHARAKAAVDEAHAAVGPDTIAKILFTSGSTGIPKGVINTQRVLCSNQEIFNSVFPFLREEPPVLCDWLPWNHTFAGNADFGMALYNGGSLYLDEGRPEPGGMEATVRNLEDVAPTVYLNVPRGYEALVPYLRERPVFRKRFFSRLRMMYYAGASLSQSVWDELQDLAIEACGERILMLTGLGSTETGPHAMFSNKNARRAGDVGVPGPGVELKLVTAAGKLEARLRGPSITPGYWRQDELTRAAFDEEGFYRLGDALRFVQPGDPSKGFIFDGRIAEDFKLSTGTWVSVGPLRAKFLSHCAPYAQDVVIAGHDRDAVTALIFPEIEACRRLCPEQLQRASKTEILASQPVRAKFQALLRELAATSTGSSNRIARALLLEQPPSIDAHEVTDKGSLNQGAVLRNRAALVEELYAREASLRVIGL